MVSDNKMKVYLVSLAFILFSVMLVGLFWLATTPEQTAGLALSYAAGLSMIFLPCTLPLAFIIVPLSMGKGYRKGLGMALMFGLGLAITLSIYGVTIAFLGKLFGVDQATRFMFVVAGLAAFLFGLSELKLLRLRIPGYSGAAPAFIEKRGDYLKTFFLGLFLGNAGVGCPNPAFYVLLAYIANVGSVAYGGWLGLIHGIGRATPLIFLSILGILGINATQSLVKRKITIDKIVGWALIGIGAYILLFGLFGMYFFETSPVHEGWNDLVTGVAPGIAESQEAGAAAGVIMQPSQLEKYVPGIPWLFFALLIGLSVMWYKIKYKKGGKSEK